MAQDTNEIDVRAWCVRILKNWYWILLSCTLFFILGGLYYLSTTKKFKVDADIMIRSQENDNFGNAELMSFIGLGASKIVEDEVAILSSRDIIAQVIKDLDLQNEYRKREGLQWKGQYPRHDLSVVYPVSFLDTTQRGTRINIKVRKQDYVVKVRYGRHQTSKHVVTDLTAPINTCAGTLSFTVNTALERGDKYRITTSPRISLTESYKKTIAASPMKKESKIINISTTTDMPRRAVDFINREIELYNMNAVVDKNIVANNTASFIEERLRLISAELSDAEKDVERYKEKYGIVNLPAEAGMYLQEGTEYRKRAAEIETQLNLVQYIGEFVADETKQNSLIPANIGITDNALVTLIAEYNQLLLQRMRVQRTATESNPVIDQMNMQLVTLRENIVTSIASVKNSLLISKNDFDARVNTIQSQRGNVPGQERQYLEMERKRQLIETLYLFLYEKREENALMLASTVMPAKIVAAPQTNPTPVAPRLKILFLICLVLGIGVPIALLYLHDLFDTRINDDIKEFEKQVPVPFGGALIMNHHGGSIAVHEGKNSASAELFRLLRTNVRFMLPADTQTPVILVTSSVNGEGKTYVASNLAISLALLQKKVALVGLDIRKPMLSKTFSLNTQGCLTGFLSDNAYSVDDVICPSAIEGLDILPAGVVPPNPNELLQTQRLDLLFAELRKRYDYVIVDSAPVALISDTFLLQRVSDMTIYVCRANYTTRDMIDYLGQVKEKNRLPNIIAVLNAANAKSLGYGYGYGYSRNDQPKKWWQRILHR